jgi:hypothetical protein
LSGPSKSRRYPKENLQISIFNSNTSDGIQTQNKWDPYSIEEKLDVNSSIMYLNIFL